MMTVVGVITSGGGGCLICTSLKSLTLFFAFCFLLAFFLSLSLSLSLDSRKGK